MTAAKTAIFLCLSVYWNAVIAYSEATHSGIARETLPRTNFEEYVSTTLGFGTDTQYASTDAMRTGRDWIYQGAEDEDAFPRFFNHFYDPVNDSGVYARTPDWALEDVAEYASQQYSLGDAHEYLYQALTTPGDEAAREVAIGSYFYALGHVLHLLADMAQPEHVRNDMHPTQVFESYVRRLSSLPIDDYPRPAIRTARSLWVAPDGTGLSNYTNRGFVSGDTNFDAATYPLPSLAASLQTTAKLSNLLAEKGERPVADSWGQPIDGEVEFVGNWVADDVTGYTTPNGLAASYSIFNHELTAYNECVMYGEFPSICKTYTLNQFNFDAMLEFLIPRAIGYGEALIEHLYRGRMDFRVRVAAEEPRLDYNPISGGIETLPVEIRNTTPSGETMGGGTLVAAVSYLDGGQRKHVVSTEIPAVAPQSEFSEYVFDFTFQPIPLPLQDAFVQVIYRGALGEEAETIVVARKPLEETGLGLLAQPPLTIARPAQGVFAVPTMRPRRRSARSNSRSRHRRPSTHRVNWSPWCVFTAMNVTCRISRASGRLKAGCRAPITGPRWRRRLSQHPSPPSPLRTAPKNSCSISAPPPYR